MSSATIERCFLYKKKAKKLTRITGLAIDASLNIGDKTYEEHEEEATSKFITTKKTSLPFLFLGHSIK